MLDFKSIAQFSIMELADKMGSQLSETTTNLNGETVPQFVGPCPISKTAGKVFKVTPKLNRFVCWCLSCKQQPKPGGDIIELMRRIKNCDVRTAAQEVQSLFNGVGEADDNPPPKQEAASPASKPSSFDPLKYLETLDPAHDALAHLGLSPETLRAAKAGYASKGLNRGRLAVWCEEMGAFVGIALNGEEPRFVVPKGKSLPPLLDIVQAVWNAR